MQRREARATAKEPSWPRIRNGLRAKIRKLETRLHAKDLAAGDVRHERTTLADRLREDYGIDLAAIDEPSTAELAEVRQQVEAEIADLRSKLNSIGGVNLDCPGRIGRARSPLRHAVGAARRI